MANGKDLELALRIRADLGQGQAALKELGQAVESVGQQATTTGQQLANVGESADQQAQRLQAMIAASLQNTAAQDAMTASSQRLSAAVQAGNVSWQASADAQSSAMNTYHNTERAEASLALAKQRAAEEAAKATAEEGRHQGALQKLLNQIDPTRVAMARLDTQTEELGRHFDEGRISAEDYNRQLAILDRRVAQLDGAGASLGSIDLTTVESQGQMVNLLRDLATGDWTGAAHNLAMLSSRIQGVGTALGSWAVPLAVSIAGLAAFGATAYAAADDIDAINEQLASNGALASYSAGQLNAMAVSIGAASGKTALARDVLTGLAKDGQFVGTALAEVGIAATAMAQLTGQSADEVVSYFLDMENGVAKWAAAANDEYQFLTLAQYEHIASLERRGEKEQAAALVTGILAAEEKQRLADVKESLGGLESAWDSARGAALNYWEKTKLLARLATGNGTAEDEMAARGFENRFTLNPSRREQNNQRLKELEDENRQAAERNAAEALERKNQTESVSALAELELQLQAVDKAYGKVQATRELNAKFSKIWEQAALEGTNPELLNGVTSDGKGAFSGGAYDDLLKGLETKFKVTASAAEKASDTLAKQNQQWVEQLEKEAATFGKGKASTREYELDQRNLTGALKARAEAAYVMLDAAEKQKKADDQAKKDAKTLAQLNLDLLKASGQNIDAAGAEIEKKYGALQKRLLAAGDTKGAGLVTQLMGIEQAKAELDDLEQALDRVFSEQARQEQTISTQQEAGLISELSARRQILDLNALTAAQIEKLLPAMRELAAVTGDPAAIERVKDLEVRLGALRTVANQVSNALKAGFETGLAGALEGLATGTMNLQEAATSFVRSIASSMAQLASQQLAMMAANSVMGMFAGASGTGYTGAFGFATGGRVQGPGTGTSDSISAWLSNDEFVTRAAVVTQPGALGFLDDFNTRGMVALDDWARVRHSTGGLAGVPAPALPRPSMGAGRLAEPAAAMSSTLNNQQAFYLLDDPSRMAEAISSKQGVEAIVVMMSRDPAKFRSILKLQG
ncbi:MAG TPA: phage tail length tape measure family protein [Pseudomonas sp.]|nr:phage tail length tape measure family protein [Pseudomonas sp.]